MADESSSMSDATNKYVMFEENIRKLFTACDNIKQVVSSHGAISKKNPVYLGYDRFKEAYNEIGAEDTIFMFEEFYNRKRYQILSKTDGWIKDRAVIEYPTKKKTKQPRSVMLSIFYRHAQRLSKEAEKEVNEFNREDQAENVFLPDELIYTLLKIFSLVAPMEDIEKLNEYISIVESELPSTEIAPNTANPMAGMGNIGDFLNNALGGIDFKSLSKNLGLDEEGNLPEGTNIQDVMTGVISNPKTQEVLNRTLDKFKNSKESGNIGNVIGDLLSDKELHESFKNLIPDSTPEPISDPESKRLIQEAKNAHPDVNTEIIDASDLSASTTTMEEGVNTNTTSVLHLDLPNSPKNQP